MKVGQNVMYNGFPGTITEVCAGKLSGMLVVCLERGDVCVSASQVLNLGELEDALEASIAIDSSRAKQSGLAS